MAKRGLSMVHSNWIGSISIVAMLNAIGDENEEIYSPRSLVVLLVWIKSVSGGRVRVGVRMDPSHPPPGLEDEERDERHIWVFGSTFECTHKRLSGK